jgi:hypothetical protein
MEIYKIKEFLDIDDKDTGLFAIGFIPMSIYKLQVVLTSQELLNMSSGFVLTELVVRPILAGILLLGGYHSLSLVFKLLISIIKRVFAIR